jgi:hypothetical protein
VSRLFLLHPFNLHDSCQVYFIAFIVTSRCLLDNCVFPSSLATGRSLFTEFCAASASTTPSQGGLLSFTWVEIACSSPSSPSSLRCYELGLTRCYLVYCTTAQVAISIASSAVASQASVYSLEHSGSSSINTTATTGTMTTSGASSTVTGNSTSTGLNTTSGLSSGATTTTSGASGSTTNQATGTSSSGGLDAAAISSAVSPPFFSLSDTTQCEMQRH